MVFIVAIVYKTWLKIYIKWRTSLMEIGFRRIFSVNGKGVSVPFLRWVIVPMDSKLKNKIFEL